VEQQAPVWLPIWSNYLCSLTSHKLTPIELDLFCRLGFITHDGIVPSHRGTQRMDKPFEPTSTSLVAHGQ
jgi:hypothetical protein